MKSYYKIIQGQRYDRKLLELAENLIDGQGDGRISQNDAAKLIESVKDGRGITQIERNTVAYIAKYFNLTDLARKWVKEQFDFMPEKTLDEQIREIIEVKHQALGLDFVYDEEEVKSQENLSINKLFFLEALDLAFEAILGDGNESETPRNIVVHVYEFFDTPNPNDGIQEQILAKIREHLAGATLRLLPNVDWSDYDQEFDFYPPENRESAAENWVFGLNMPSLSDHLYWIIADRKKIAEPFIYGFN